MSQLNQATATYAPIFVFFLVGSKSWSNMRQTCLGPIYFWFRDQILCEHKKQTNNRAGMIRFCPITVVYYNTLGPIRYVLQYSVDQGCNYNRLNATNFLVIINCYLLHTQTIAQFMPQR